VAQNCLPSLINDRQTVTLEVNNNLLLILMPLITGAVFYCTKMNAD
jgi:hypothetical protein